jgi:hypothetical protein
VLSSVAQVLFALNRRYLINEKGALNEAATLPLTMPNLEKRVHDVWSRIGSTDLEGALNDLEALLDAQDEIASKATSPAEASDWGLAPGGGQIVPKRLDLGTRVAGDR